MSIKITPEELAKSAIKYRKTLLSMPTIGLEESLKHMTLVPGVQYKQTVGEIHDDSEVGSYDPDRISNDPEIEGRTLEVFLGSLIRRFDPNTIFQSIYGSLILKGEGLKNTEITKAILAVMMKRVSRGLNGALFSAVQKPKGPKSIDLFNGFDTIANKEITDTKISEARKNLYLFSEKVDKNNAKDLLKDYYRNAVDELKAVPTKMIVPYYVKEAYDDAYQVEAGSVVYNKQFTQTFLEGSDGKCEIVALSNKAGSNLIQLTTKDNMLIGTGNGNDLESIDVGKYHELLVSLTAVLLFGVQYDTISPEKLLIGKLSNV